MYLLDTVVISELRRKTPSRSVVGWINSVDESDLYLSVITCAEIVSGIERQKSGNPDFARELEGWLNITLRLYGDRILPISVPVARRWGELNAALGNRSLDLAIAATALEHRLTVVTRNVGDFEPIGTTILNPFE